MTGKIVSNHFSLPKNSYFFKTINNKNKNSNQVQSLEVSKISKNKLLKIFTVFSVIGLLSLAIMASPASALISQNTKAWYWTSDTNAVSIATGDVNNDTVAEIVTAGYYSDGMRYNGQVAVWNASNMALENIKAWYWTNDTQVASVAIGDVDGDGLNEIVTGGSYFDGTRWVAQLCVWNGSNISLKNVQTWYWTGDTQISSVAVANITQGAFLDIITGGAYFDGTRWVAQLATWNGVTLALEGVTVWYWTQSTYINSVAAADISGTGVVSIVTGGSYFDGTRWNAQLAVWNGATLAFTNVAPWFWTSDTEINAVALANITGGTTLSIITGGDYFDLTRYNSQLAVWDGATLALQSATSWFIVSNTRISSLVAANYTGGANLDIIIGSTFNDGQRNNAQIIDANGGTLATISSTNWFVTANTEVNSVAVANFGLGNRIISVGSFFDNTRQNAQITIWG